MGAADSELAALATERLGCNQFTLAVSLHAPRPRAARGAETHGHILPDLPKLL